MTDMSEKRPRERRHLLIETDLYRKVKIEAVKADLEISQATEVLYSMWVNGHIDKEKFAVIAKLFGGK